MKPLLRCLLLAFATCCPVMSDETYSNAEYGIELTARNGWDIVYSAQLRVPLNQLTDEQLAELIKAYDRGRIIALEKDIGHTNALVEVFFHEYDSGGARSALDIARDKSAYQSNGFRVTAKAHVAPVCGSEAGIFSAAQASKSNRTPDTDSTFFYIPRSRTFVELRITLPYNADESLRKDAIAMLGSISISTKADELLP